jgi:hypothetical protein
VPFFHLFFLKLALIGLPVTSRVIERTIIEVMSIMRVSANPVLKLVFRCQFSVTQNPKYKSSLLVLYFFNKPFAY